MFQDLVGPIYLPLPPRAMIKKRCCPFLYTKMNTPEIPSLFSRARTPYPYPSSPPPTASHLLHFLLLRLLLIPTKIRINRLRLRLPPGIRKHWIFLRLLCIFQQCLPWILIPHTAQRDVISHMLFIWIRLRKRRRHGDMGAAGIT